MFSWDGLWLSLILLFTISPVGVTFCYHRMLSHKAFKVPKWLEYGAALVGGLSAQGPIRSWVAAHRIHHRYSDMPGDLHSPRGKGFWFSHMVHLLYDDPRMHDEKIWSKYTPDLNNQKFYRFMDKGWWAVAFSIVPVLYYFGGWTYVMWGGPIRVVLMLHLTWFVNSATHAWGYRTYPTRDLSRNNWWVGILAAGEGWHNNHHAQANCARHGQKWYEIDITWYLIWTLEQLGLAWDVKRPKPYVQAESEREDVLALGQ
jgi:stearoyl-CoA desaturase (delta-9 desaturase)